jgi:glycosyltransferase involved in cell wall biosynthesis
VAHARYRRRGGEDAVFEDEVAMLRGFGQQVEVFERHNDDLAGRHALRLARDTVWAPGPARELAAAIAAFRPDVIHAHNTFPSLSPALAWVASRAGVPYVQTLHNFRLVCPQGMLQRDGRSCMDCVGRLPLPAIRHACYRDSRAATGAVAAMLAGHRLLGTWRRKVARFIALSEFSRGVLIAGGLPGERIAVKPNFVADPLADGSAEGGVGLARGDCLLFVGRLVADKGIGILAAIAAAMPELRVRVLGDGPQRGLLEALPNVELLGEQPAEGVRREMAGAAALVLPSVGHENFPRSLVEAGALGLPVFASDQGALREIVVDGATGWLLPPGDVAAWVAAIRSARAQAGELARRGANARACYLARWTPQRNFERLMAIYSEVIRIEGPTLLHSEDS